MRTRTHILEEESFLELKKILPREWVVREKSKDYGVDLEIEIFDLNGNYTGAVFWIQLKATDSEKTKDHKSIRIPTLKINQLASYDLPLAIFRYNSTNKTFYFDWIKRYAYLASGSKSLSFNIEFQNHNLWSEDSPNQIISFFKNRNRFINNKFSFPIKGFINNINAPDKTARKLSVNILKSTSLISITRDRYLADIEINLLENRIVLNLSNSCGGSIGYKKEDSANEIYVLNAFKTCFLLILSQTDKDIEFFKFITENNLLNEVINQPELLHYLLPKLLVSESGKHFTDEIVNHVFKFGDPLTSAIIQTIIFLSSQNIISQDRVESYFYLLIELSKESKIDKSLATTYYNFGGYYRGISIYEKAFHYYNKAYKTNSNYINREYFCRELGGILFELRFFKLSAKLYEKAIILNPENIFLLATVGDAEFYSGNYSKALNYFDDFLTKNANQIYDKYEFSLKFTICNSLIEFLETGSQKRNEKKSKEILKSLNSEDLLDSLKLDEIIKIDALNPIAWSYYSIICLKDQNLNMLFIASLIQAVITKYEAKIWAYLAILTTFESMPSNLLNDIVNTAYYYTSENFMLELQEMSELEEFDGLNAKEFIKDVEGLIKSRKESPMEVRFWNDDEDEVNIIEL